MTTKQVYNITLMQEYSDEVSLFQLSIDKIVLIPKI